MEKVLILSREIPPDSKKGLTSSVRASVVIRPLILKTISSYSVCVVLISAATYFGQISAEDKFFSVESASYKCSYNIICLGRAEEYNTNGTQVGQLSLIPKPGSDYHQSLFQSGLAYYHEQVRLLDSSTKISASFNTSFAIDVVQGRVNGQSIVGDGMAFVISANNSIIGSSGKYLGIFSEGGTTTFKSIVVEFDTFLNRDVHDISNNHVSFDFANISYAVAANASDANVTLGDEGTFYAWVQYTNENQQLEVRVSNYNSRPMEPLLKYTVNLLDVAVDYMWVGFSGGSGGAYSNYYVGNWTFESYGILDSKSGDEKRGSIVGMSVGIPTFLLACILIGVFVRRRFASRVQLRARAKFMKEEIMMQLEGMPERFSYNQLRVATRAFSQQSKLGEGGFGTVYRGVLPLSGVPVAVKKINSDSSQGEKEFTAEVSIISRLRHRNLIQLLGWCKDASKGNYLLVYELMPNGSLDKVLFGTENEKRMPSLSWLQRFNIVTGIAAALDYLHQGWMQQVIHRDIKATNIMLDKDWNAKLGDFGLARLVDHQKEGATTLVAGTYGYIAPEVPATGRFTEKSDVYAFGAVVLEVACGRKALSTDLPDDEVLLVDWVWQSLSEGDLMRTVDKRLQDYDSYWMEVMLTVGLLCSHPNPLARPSMKHVVQVLAGDVPVPLIPLSKPRLVFSTVAGRVSINYHDSSKTRITDISTGNASDL